MTHQSMSHRIIAVTFAMSLLPSVARACAVCFGNADDPAVAGIKVAMFMLLGVTGTVLTGITGFFLHLRRRERWIRERDMDTTDERGV